jgi:hypothetical protein
VTLEPAPMPAPVPPVPMYGVASLAEVVPSVLSALGVETFENRLGIEPLGGVCLLVVDGLGWELLLAHPGDAPFLVGAAGNSRAGRAITAGFPSTTSASLASLGTGLPPGRHGLLGYTFRIPGYDRPLNALQWQLYGIGPHVDLTEAFPPEQAQPEPTVMQRSSAAGMEVDVIGPSAFRDTALTRAILRGGRYLGADSLEALVTTARHALASRERPTVYAYHPFLDTMGHMRGAGSDDWRGYLTQVDAAAAGIAEGLPHGAALVVTADHGMVNLAEHQRVDVADRPELLAGVEMLAGEARARHVHVRPGALDDVLAVWREVLGDRMWIVPGEEAVAGGWFGPSVSEGARPRIGDVVAAAHGPVGVFQREVDPLQWSLVGHHGSMTVDEQLVPLLVIRG